MSKNKVKIKEWRYENDGHFLWKIYDGDGRIVVRAAMEEDEAALIVESVNSHIVMLKACHNCGGVVCKDATKCLRCHSDNPHAKANVKSKCKGVAIAVAVAVIVWIIFLI